MRLGEQNMLIQGATVCNSASNLSVYGRLDHLETKKARAIISELHKTFFKKNSSSVFYWDGFWLASQKSFVNTFAASPR